MNKRSGWLLHAVYAGGAAVLLLGGCGLDDDNPGAGAGGSQGTGGMTTGAGGNAGAGGGAVCHAPGTIVVTNSGATAYVMDGASDPTLTLCRGSTYTFAVNTPGHPFYIKTVQAAGTDNAYSTGVTSNGESGGDVVFTVPAAAPDTLYYICSLHAAMTGTIDIVD